MIKFITYLKKYWLLILLLIVATLIEVNANLTLPDYLSKIINEGILLQNQDLIVERGVDMLGVAFVGSIGTILGSLFASLIAAGYARDVRNKLFRKVESFSLEEMDEFATSSLITRSTNDVQQVQTVILVLLRMVFSAVITGVFAVQKAYVLAGDLSWIMWASVAALVTIIIVLITIAVPKFQSVQKLTDKLNLVSRENITGIRVIRAFDTEKLEEQKFSQVNEDVTGANLFITRLTALIQPFMFLILNLASIGIVWFGSHLIADDLLQIGDMLAYMQYVMQVIIAFLMISIVFIMVPRAIVSARRIAQVLRSEPKIQDPDVPKDFKSIKGVIEFKDVTFGYSSADEPVLENISFIAKPGEVTAVIGGTGSGKSTIVKLIPRFYEVMYGEIEIDGVNIKDINQADLRDKIGYVPQKVTLFNDSVENNIKYGAPEASPDIIKKSAEIAQASEFIDDLPEGYKTIVSQGATNLSGGQKQRISIARAIANDPDILIFDDSFSALDFRTDAKLREALNKIIKTKTVLVVAQRINSIMRADQIIVLDKGRIVGKGRHKQLMADCEVYQNIAESQLTEEEITKSLK